MSEPIPPFEPGRTYRVTLMRAVRVGGVPFRPLGELKMDGAYLTRLIEENGADAVAAVTD
ncbi:hypothetical protein C3941_09460 [Kaistia algarum]|uniref:hypothetical protein n=1 Tax=Kaistia algarum TaxID=2083279 RepID=UPI000CE767C6|nr:hypothetical protein [Kaistia algarum]MCX5512285.1 hypothetical protein [Kaistia algarum]PPE80376.1 hypothetical protein C3941_09460 [Kaistia algarum]